MGSKTVPLSVRISHEDAEFLAKLEVDNAKTPSDKVRAIIAERRRLAPEGHSYSQVLSWNESSLAPMLLKLREIQNREKEYSEVIRIAAEWLPDVLAHFLIEGKNVQDKQGLAKLEADITDKVFRLIEATLRLGVTEESPCIDKRAISKRIATSIELVKVIQNRLQKQTGE